MINREHIELMSNIAAYNGWQLWKDDEGDVLGFIISEVFQCWVHQPYGKNPFFSFNFGLTKKYYATKGSLPAIIENGITNAYIRCKVGQSFEAYARKLKKIYDALKEYEKSIIAKNKSDLDYKRNACDAVAKIADYLGKEYRPNTERDYWHLKDSNKVEVQYGKATLTLGDLTPEQAIQLIEKLGLKE